MTQDTSCKCPNCAGEYFEIMHTSQTLLHAAPTLMSKGVIERPSNPNIITYHVRCISCKHFFDVKTQHGKFVK